MNFVKTLCLFLIFLGVSNVRGMSQEEANVLLLQGAVEGNLQKIKNALAYGADINARDRYDNDALILNVENNNSDSKIIEYLIKNGVNINRPNYYSSLDFAIVFGKTEIVRKLLEYNFDLNIPDKNGWTPLFKALQAGKGGNITIVKMLLDKGASPQDESQNWDHYTPIMQALHSYDYRRIEKTEKIIKLLIAYGADINYQTKDNSALKTTIQMSNRDLLDIVLRVGADPLKKQKVSPKSFVAPYEDAYYYIHHDYRGTEKGAQEMRKLVSDFVDLRKQLKEQIFKAVKEGNLHDMKNVAIKYPWVLGLQNDDSQTPLHIALRKRDKQMIKAMMFIDPKIFVRLQNKKDKQGFTPLMLAADAPDIMEILVKGEPIPMDID